MAALLKIIVDFFTSQWEIVSGSWSFYLIGIIFVGVLEWIIISWVKKEKFESVKERLTLAEERHSKLEKEIEKLGEELLKHEGKFQRLEIENKSLKKGVFLDEKSRIDGLTDLLDDMIIGKTRKESKLFILEILETTKKIILGKEYESKRPNFSDEYNSSINLSSQTFVIKEKFHENIILYHELINKIMGKVDKEYIPVMMAKSTLKISSKERKVMLLNHLINRVKMIPN